MCVCVCVVHPGGRSILEGLASACSLSPQQLQHSYSVLRQCGNMSSATVWFVLDSLRRRTPDIAASAATAAATATATGSVAAAAVGGAGNDPFCVALAFGPGWPSSALLQRIINDAS